MNKWSNRLTLLLPILFIISQFITFPVLIYSLTLITICIITFSIIYSKTLPKLFGITMVIIGFLIMIIKDQPLETWISAINKNVPLASLIILVPILGIPINIGKYHDRLAGLATKMKNKSHLLYLFISVLYLIFAPLVNLGSVPIIHSMLRKLNLPKSLLARAYIRGFTSVYTWSPYFASVFLVVFTLELTISEYIPYGLILGVIQFLIGYLIFLLVEQRDIKIDSINVLDYESPKKIFELFIVVFVMIGLIFTFEQYMNMSTSVLIMLIVSIFAIVWSLYLSTPKELIGELKRFSETNMPEKANEINLLLTAGFFAYVLSKTTATQFINAWWGGVAGVSVLLVIFMTIVLIALLSFIGVHQIVSISAIIATVSYEHFNIHVITMAMMLLSSWAISATVSLVSPVNIVTTNILHLNMLKVILRWNLLYSILIIIAHSITIYLVHLIISQ